MILDTVEARIVRKEGDFYCLNIKVKTPYEIYVPISLAEEDLLIGQSVSISSIEDSEGFRKLRIISRKPKFNKRKQKLIREIEEFISD